MSSLNMSRTWGYAFNRVAATAVAPARLDPAPGCTINVYLTGTLTHATIYSDAAGTTPLANPFAANAVTGYFDFYVSQGVRIDIRFSGTGITTPYTLGDATVILDRVYTVETFGAVGDGVTDDSAAFAAAIAAIPATGGTVVAANGPYAVNITIDRPKVRLAGSHIGRPSSASTVGGLVPYDITLPTVTLSSDATLNEGIQLADLEINGKGTGYYGIKMLGGTYSGTFDNITIQNFIKKCLWVQSGAVQPCAYLYFNGVLIQPAVAASEHAIYVQQSSVASFIEAIFMDGIRVSGVAHGYVLENAGSSTLSLSNTWFQIAASGNGVLLSKPFSTNSKLRCNGVVLDSNSSADTLAGQNYDTAGNPAENYIIGMCSIDGKFDSNGTLLVVNESPMFIPDRTMTLEPRSWGHHAFVDNTNPNASSPYIYGETSAGRLNLVAANDILAVSTAGILHNYAAGLTATTFKQTNSAGVSKITANGTTTEIEPISGGKVWLKTNSIDFGATALGLVVDQSTGRWKFTGKLIPTNNAGYGQFAADGVTVLGVATYDGSNNLFIGNTASAPGTRTSLYGGSANLYFVVNVTTTLDLQTDRLNPFTDNNLYCGDGSHRFITYYGINGAINTSDAREKQDIAPIDDPVLDAWATVDYVQYRRIASVEAQGDGARIHHGVLAQAILRAFTDKGLDPHRYGLFCYDEWEAKDEVEGQDVVEEQIDIPNPMFGLDDPLALADPEYLPAPATLTVTVERRVDRLRHTPAGNRYGVRYDQCLVLEAALQRRITVRLEARLAALEARDHA